jgi:hypothetical protein
MNTEARCESGEKWVSSFVAKLPDLVHLGAATLVSADPSDRAV